MFFVESNDLKSGIFPSCLIVAQYYAYRVPNPIYPQKSQEMVKKCLPI
jgi:hypothetical protein